MEILIFATCAWLGYWLGHSLYVLGCALLSI